MQYMDEQMGVQYLFFQLGSTLGTDRLDGEIYEGFAGVDKEVEDDVVAFKEEEMAVEIPTKKNKDKLTDDIEKLVVCYPFF